MPSFTQCIDDLKLDILRIAGRPMCQRYPDDLGTVLVDVSGETLAAKQFADALSQPGSELKKNRIDDPYPAKVLQCAWNIADILSVAIRYSPREWSAGLFRGLTAQGFNNNINGANILISINYMVNDGFSITPHTVDDTTCEINKAFLRFINGVQKTRNGASVLATLRTISPLFSSKPIALEDEIIKTATAGIANYEQYKLRREAMLAKDDHSRRPDYTAHFKSQLSLLFPTKNEPEEDDDSNFFDAKTGEENEPITEIISSVVSVVTASLDSLYEHREEIDGDIYFDTKEALYQITDEALKDNPDPSVIRDSIANDGLDVFFKKYQSRSWVQCIIDAFSFLKQKIVDCIHWMSIGPSSSGHPSKP